MGNYSGFQKVKLTKPQRSTFDLSHEVRSTYGAGWLNPILTLECVPSDSFNGSSEMLVRLAPLLAPIYDNIQVFVHYFFVPNRLLWEDWEVFITGGRVGLGTAQTPPADIPIPPQFDIENELVAVPTIFGKNTLADFLGVPPIPLAGETAVDYADLTIDAMPFAAYQLIYMEYYRDRNFVVDDAYEFPLASGVQASDSLMVQQFRSYNHDYFTSALPFTQRGEQVLIPLDGSVTYLQQSIVKRSDTGDTLTNNDLIASTQDVPDFPPGSLTFQNAPNTEGVASRIENIDSISNATTTINDFRSAYALQVWLERNAVGGSRYTESTQAHFGVRPQDSRLQRPEYIGGGLINVKISEIVAPNYSTNADDDVVPAGNLGGHGVSYGNTNKFKYFCTEHGFIMGIMSIVSKGSYHQGMPRMFRRRSFLDYPWPTFAKLGEQTISKSELYANAATLTPDGDGELPLFGYQSRYADWKYMCSTNRGDFHDTMLFWTMTRNFSSAPELGEVFNLIDAGAMERPFVVQGTQSNFWCYIRNNVYVKRPLPYFGTPNTLGFV